MKQIPCQIEFDLIKAIFWLIDVIIGFGIGVFLKVVIFK